MTGIYKATGADHVTPSDLSDELNRKPSKIDELPILGKWNKKGFPAKYYRNNSVMGEFPRKIRNGHVHFCISNDRNDSV
jgi:hypothetical protein